MSTLLSNIKLICNYTENNKPSLPKGVIYYTDTLSSDDEWIMNEFKRRHRQSSINSVLDEKQEEYDDMDWLPQGIDDGLNTIRTFSTRMMSQNVTAKKFISEELLYNDIISTLDTLTSKPMKKCKFHPDVTLKLKNDKFLTTNEQSDADSRRIITKMTFISNVLSMKSNLGPATAFIIGDNILEYLLSTSYNFNLSNNYDDIIGNINGAQVIHSSKINPSKVIGVRPKGERCTGLNVVNNVNNGDNYQTYFIKETPTFENRIVWFEIS